MIYALFGLILLGIVFLVIRLKKDDDHIKFEFHEASLTPQEKEFLGLLNVFRTNNGVVPLKADTHAGLVAMRHNAEMIFNEKVTHEGIDREDLFTSGAFEVNDIVGGYYTSVSGAFKAFVDSEDHVRIMRGKSFNTCGLDIMKNENGKLFITCIFMRI